jgi:hypothetical protein
VLGSALALFVGIEPTIVLRDVCMLSSREAKEAKMWGAAALLAVALNEPAENLNERPRRSPAGNSQAMRLPSPLK